jgi:hypothetical protein
LRQIVEISIKGAQCFQKTVPVLVAASFDASQQRSTSRLQQFELNGLTQKRDQLDTEVASSTAAMAALEPEADFLKTTLPLLQVALDTVSDVIFAQRGPSALKSDFALPEGEDVTLPIEASATIRLALADFSRAIGNVDQEHRSAQITRRLDNRLLRFLEFEGGAIQTSKPLDAAETAAFLSASNNDKNDLQEREIELELEHEKLKRQLAQRETSKTAVQKEVAETLASFEDNQPLATDCPQKRGSALRISHAAATMKPYRRCPSGPGCW